MNRKCLGVVAASALVVLMAQPADAVTKQSRTIYEVSRNPDLRGWDAYDLEDESADRVSNKENKEKCPQKCTSSRNEAGGGGGGLGGIGAALGSEGSFAAALLGGGGGGSGGGKQSHNELNLSDNSSSSPNGQQFDPPGSPSISAAPLPAALPLFASGLAAMGVFGWWRKRKAPAKQGK